MQRVMCLRTSSSACPTRMRLPIQPRSSHGSRPSSRRLARQRFGEILRPICAATSPCDARLISEIEGKRVSVMPRRPLRTTRVGKARSGGESGMIHWTSAAPSSSGSTVMSGNLGCESVTVPRSVSQRDEIACMPGALAARAKFAQGTHSGLASSNLLASWAMAQRRSHGRVWCLVRKVRTRRSRPQDFMG